MVSMALLWNPFLYCSIFQQIIGIQPSAQHLQSMILNGFMGTLFVAMLPFFFGVIPEYESYLLH